VDVAGLRHRAAATTRPLSQPYALYLGKIARNKGTDHLLRVVREAELQWPLVIAGDGPDRAALEAEAPQTGGDVRFTGWLESEEAMRWLAHAAMHTGGTGDIIEDERTGLLSATPDELAADVRRLILDPDLRMRLGAAARHRVFERFDARNVVRRVADLYQILVAETVA
jgi:glycosyltransferase involved in cell wall biosynthesis